MTELQTISTPTSLADTIASEVRSWWATETSDWDAEVTGAAPDSLPGGADLWDSMPTVDSKAVARTSHIFKQHLGIPLDVSLIRSGGYKSIEDMIGDVVPKMVKLSKQKKGTKK